MTGQNDRILFELDDPEKLADRYSELRSRYADRPQSRWLLRIKELRARHGVSILEAERIALEEPAIRRWALKMMNSNQTCRKAAQSHIRHNGEKSLIETDGFVFSYRQECDS
ncbi:hypothetical protein AAG612_01650 [Citromicrobium bathyomarinum]|uniref:hypothetical protein n=1 Tax=Citromicrobium bathyomarinum TaxID=72174 RepID=UPI00315A9E37